MAFNFYLGQTIRITANDAFASNDRTTEFQTNNLRVTAASAHNKTYRSLSAGVSNQEINLAPITGSNPGMVIAVFADQPIDVRLGASGNTMISCVYQLMLAVSNQLSALFIGVPGSLYGANVAIHAVAGGSLSVSTPLP